MANNPLEGDVLVLKKYTKKKKHKKIRSVKIHFGIYIDPTNDWPKIKTGDSVS